MHYYIEFLQRKGYFFLLLSSPFVNVNNNSIVLKAQRGNWKLHSNWWENSKLFQQYRGFARWGWEYICNKVTITLLIDRRMSIRCITGSFLPSEHWFREDTRKTRDFVSQLCFSLSVTNSLLKMGLSNEPGLLLARINMRCYYTVINYVLCISKVPFSEFFSDILVSLWP